MGEKYTGSPSLTSETNITPPQLSTSTPISARSIGSEQISRSPTSPVRDTTEETSLTEDHQSPKSATNNSLSSDSSGHDTPPRRIATEARSIGSEQIPRSPTSPVRDTTLETSLTEDHQSPKSATNNSLSSDSSGHDTPPRRIATEDLSTLQKYTASVAPNIKHTDRSSFDSRLETFHYWPVSVRQRPEDLAEAGFFYTYMGDHAICFYCGGGLNTWEDNDDPWEQHAQWFPKCGYLLMKKGQAFVDEVKRRLGIQQSSTRSGDTQPAEGSLLNKVSKMQLFNPSGASGDSASVSTQTLSASEETASFSKETAPALKLTTSSSKETVSTSKETASSSKETASSSKETESASKQTASSSKEIGSSKQTAATSKETASSSKETESPSKQTESASRETATASTQTASDSEEVASASMNVAPTSKKIASSSCATSSFQAQAGKSSEPSEELSRDRMCKICYVNEIQIVFLPCGHMVACIDCAAALTVCAICKQKIQATIKAFLS